MMEAFPLTDVIGKVLKGSGECAEVQWQFLNFSMAEWDGRGFCCNGFYRIATFVFKRKILFHRQLWSIGKRFSDSCGLQIESPGHLPLTI